MPWKIPQNLTLEGSLDFEAAAGEGAEAKDNTFTLVANTGKPMTVAGFPYPVVMDIAGASFDKKKTPVIADHDTAKRIGHTTEQAIIPEGGEAKVAGRSYKGPVIVAQGLVSSSMGIAQGFVADAKKGFPFQVSVGATILDGFVVAEGEKVQVNGKTWKGPLIVAKRSNIRELTVCVLGADNNTSAIAAQEANNTLLELFAMNFEDFVRSMGLDPATLTADAKAKMEAHFHAHQKLTANGGGNVNAGEPDEDEEDNAGAAVNARKKIRASIAAEEDRVDQIKATANEFEDVAKVQWGGKELTLSAAKKRAITDGADPRDFRLACLQAALPTGGGVSSGPAIHVVSKDLAPAALEAAILRVAGVTMRGTNKASGKEYGVETMFKPEVLEASHGSQYRVSSISALFDLQIRATGGFYGGLDRTGSDFFAATVKAYQAVINASGFSTLNVVNVLENVMNKAAFVGFAGVEAVWPFICGRRNLTDFRPHALYRLDFNGSFRKVAADGELKHISMTDSKKTIQADTYGAMVCIDRKTMKNDDLGEIVAKALGIGTLGGSRIEESVFVTFLANAGSFFGAGNANYLSGAGSALSVTSLNDARQKFRDQVVNGKPISVSPRILLTGTTLETTANRLWAEERTEVGGGNTDTGQVFVNNPHKGLYRPYVSGYMNNTGILDQDGNAISGQSATKWALLGDPNAPQGSAISIGFMDGRDTPFFDQAETQFNVPGGLQMRAFLDWGVALHVPQLGVLSAGA